jgi:hypothetical protein
VVNYFKFLSRFRSCVEQKKLKHSIQFNSHLGVKIIMCRKKILIALRQPFISSLSIRTYQRQIKIIQIVHTQKKKISFFLFWHLSVLNQGRIFVIPNNCLFT